MSKVSYSRPIQEFALSEDMISHDRKVAVLRDSVGSHIMSINLEAVGNPQEGEHSIAEGIE